MALKPTVKDALNLGEAALKGGGKLLPKLKRPKKKLPKSLKTSSRSESTIS